MGSGLDLTLWIKKKLLLAIAPPSDSISCTIMNQAQFYKALKLLSLKSDPDGHRPAIGMRFASFFLLQLQALHDLPADFTGG